LGGLGFLRVCAAEFAFAPRLALRPLADADAVGSCAPLAAVGTSVSVEDVFEDALGMQPASRPGALTDAARHCSDAGSREMLLNQARAIARGLGGEKFPTALRPLSALAAVAIRDCRRGEPFEAEGTPGRAAAMLRHRFTGGLPRA
jgi:hypothetical protein